MTRNTTLTTQNRTTTTTPDLDALARHAPATDDLLALAAWLATNGPAHLSQIERIELAERLITRRRFLIGAGGLLGAAALGGCGAGEEAAVPTATTGGTRLFTHAMGETEVPTDPQRIVMLDFNAIDELIALGKKPIGMLYGAQPYLEAELSDVEIVGANDGQPNLEKILLLQPDLILAWKPFMGEDIYDNLSQIAPTIVTDREGFTEWQESLRWTAAATGQSDKAEDLLASYEQRIQQVRETIGPEQIAETTVSLFAAFDSSAGLRIYVDSFANTVLQDMGFPQTPAQQALTLDGLGEASGLSFEQIPVLDANAIFFISSYLDDDYRSSIEKNPLWQQLEAVQAERVFEVNYYWAEGSIIAADLILDDIEKYLLEESN